MFRSKSIFLAAASGVAMMCHPALAQSVGPLNLPSPGTVLSPPPPAPELERRETPKLREELGLPDASEKLLDFKVSNVRIVGATVIDEQILASAFDDLLNQPITAGQLRAALDRVNAIYAKEGYALGRAYIPAQVAKGGTLIVRIVEGYIGEIRIKADDEAVRRMVEEFSRRIVAENPLRQETLERYLLLISDIPGVTLDGRLQSMDIYSGAATLALDVTSEKLSASTAVDNRANLDSAPFQAYLTGFLNNVFGYGDQFSLTVLATPEIERQQYVRGAFSSFIGTDGLRASGGLSYASSEQPDLPAGIELVSVSKQADFLLSYPLIRATKETLNTFFGVYYTDAENVLNGFTFSRDAVRAAHIGANYSSRIGQDVTVGTHMRLTKGFSVLDAGPENTPHSRLGATANFLKLQAGATVNYAATERMLLTLRTEGQYSPDSLFSSEEITFGGTRFARGYNNSEVSGDSGLGASIQASYRFESEALGGWSITPYTFVDHANVWNTDVDRQGDARLFSTGIGVNFSNRRWLSFGIELDKPINRVPLSQSDKDPRLFVSFEVRF